VALAALVALALLGLGGCRSLPPAGPDAGGGVRAARPAVPLAPDPGPASLRPLDPGFSDRRQPSAEGYLRLLVDLREQVDTEALLAGQLARGLTRQAGRTETLEALAAVAERGRAALGPLLDELAADGRVDFARFLRYRNRVFVSARPAALEPLRAHPAVAELIPEYDSVRDLRREPGSAIRAAPPIPAGNSWGVDALGLRPLWAAGVDGRGIVVGSLDSGGMGDHVLLAAGRRPEGSWYDPRGERVDPIDTKPHGSQVLACAVARPFEGRDYGAAPGASWVAALANRFNSYNNVDMALSADWMIFEARPDVLLGAWGHGKADCDPRDRALVSAARAAGIVPVFAAGNDGPDPASGQAPAALGGFAPGAGGPLAIAAVDQALTVIGPSSRGPSPCGGRSGVYPDLAGPGWQLPVPGAPHPTSFTLESGTSFAVGWVGGVAALVLQVRPELPVPEVERILRETARDLGPAGPDDDSGHGLVDPAAAVQAARAWTAAGRRP
jgi:subtilisin family serine protease